MQNNVDNPSLVFSHTNHSISKVKSLNFPVKASERNRYEFFLNYIKTNTQLYLLLISKIFPTSNRPFSSEIIAAKFFYMDQFVLLASKSNLYM